MTIDRRPRLTPIEARAILENCGIEFGTDFNALTVAQKIPLTAAADARGYRQRRAYRTFAMDFYLYVDRAARQKR